MSNLDRLYAALDDTYQPPAAALPVNKMILQPGAGAGGPLGVAGPAGVLQTTNANLADPGPLTPVGIGQLRDIFEANPDAVLALARRGVDQDLTIERLRAMIDKAEALVNAPAAGAAMLETAHAFKVAASTLPPDFDFPGYDPGSIPIDYRNTKFEPEEDGPAWVVNSGAGWLRELFARQRYAFRSHEGPASGFHYPIADGRDIALFSDFGTHLYHSRYIARHITAMQPQVAIHLGDVYYSGEQSEFDSRFINDLAPLLANTELFTLAGNHEMYSAGIPFIGYVDDRRNQNANQRQEGGYFSLENSSCQIIGIDTQYYGGGRYRNHALRKWLGDRLDAGRAANKTNIVLSSDNPYDYGSSSTNALFGDVEPFAGGIDLWFWGNTHYCALFSRGSRIPFIGSCIGHGGYPYATEKYGRKVPSGVTTLWVETLCRFGKWKLRPDRGNNGFCMMTTAQNAIVLRYFDWMRNLRCTAELQRAADGRLTPGAVTDHH